MRCAQRLSTAVQLAFRLGNWLRAGKREAHDAEESTVRNRLYSFSRRASTSNSIQFMHATRIYLRSLRICGNHETFNRLTRDESIHNLWDVRDRDAPVKKVIGFD